MPRSASNVWENHPCVFTVYLTFVSYQRVSRCTKYRLESPFIDRFYRILINHVCWLNSFSISFDSLHYNDPYRLVAESIHTLHLFELSLEYGERKVNLFLRPFSIILYLISNRINNGYRAYGYHLILNSLGLCSNFLVQFPLGCIYVKEKFCESYYLKADEDYGG